MNRQWIKWLATDPDRIVHVESMHLMESSLLREEAFIEKRLQTLRVPSSSSSTEKQTTMSVRYYMQNKKT